MPVLDRLRAYSKAAQLIQQRFPSSRGLRCQQGTTGCVAQKVLQGDCRLLTARPDTKIARQLYSMMYGSLLNLYLLEQGDIDAGVFCQLLLQLFHGEKQFIGWQYGVFNIVAPCFIAFQQLRVENLAGTAGGVRFQDAGRIRQVVKQGAGLFEEQRQVILDTRGCNSLAHLTVYIAGLRVAFETGTVALPEGTNGHLVHRELACRQHLYAATAFNGALGFRIKGPD